MRFLFLLAVLIPALASAAIVPIQNPIKAELPKRMALQDAEKTIKLALLDLGWLIRKSEPGIIAADIDVRGRHHIAVNIKYDESGLAVSYVDSQNMDYELCPSSKRAGAAAMCIHENYHGWIGNLFTALPNAMQKLELFGIVPSAVKARSASPPSPPADASPTVSPEAGSGS